MATTLDHMSSHAAPADPGVSRMALPYVRPERVRLGAGVVAATLEVGCRLLEPWPLALAVDHALGGRPLDGPLQVLAGLGGTGLLVVAGIATVGLSAAGGLLDGVSTSLTQTAAERIGGAVQGRVGGPG